HAHAPFTIVAGVTAPPGSSWTLTAELVEFVATVPAPPERGAEASLPQAPGPATAGASEPTAVYEVSGNGAEVVDLELLAGATGDLIDRLSLAATDAVAVGNPVTVAVAVGDRLKVLMVGLDDIQGQSLEAALEAQGVSVTRSTPFRMPSSLEALSVHDTVILVNVPAGEMFPEYKS